MTEDLDQQTRPADAEPSVFAQGVRYLLVGGSSALLELADLLGALEPARP